MQVKQLLRKLEAKHPEGLSTAQQFLASEDLLPVKEEEKTWNHWSFVSFWIADSFNLNTFVIASSMISAGLTWYQAFACVIVGYCLVGPLLVLNARPGAIFGLTFPSVCRTTFGVFGSLWPVFNRAVMACVWWGVQAWLGGQCVYVFIRAMAPNFANMKNLMPASSETTSAYVLSFFIYWLLSLPTIWVPIHKLRWLFLVKAIIGPIIGFAFFGWSITRAGGVGPVFSQPATLSGSDLSWQMLISISSCFNNMFTLITNAPDFASRAKTPSAAVWPQLIAMPIGFTITSFMGIMIASASAPQFGGKPIWNVVEILDLMLQNDGSSGTRAGVFFIAAGFIYVQLMLNVAANSISAGCDLTALLPRYINIRRGGYVAAIVGIAMNPWLLYKSSATFGNYLGSYGVLLSCIAGPMIADYWIVRRGHYRINDLYTAKKEGWYYYTYGINWRAYAAYLTGFAINAPGFVKSLVPTANVPIGMTRVYTLSWLVGTGVSCAVYVALCYISPPPGMNRHFVEIDESAHEIRFDNDQTEHRSSEEAERSGADEKQASKEKASQGGEVYVLPA